MDELVDCLQSSFQVTKNENSIYAAHPRSTSFKKKSTLNQDVRRERYLAAQKQRRIDYRDHARRLALDEWSDNEDEEEYEDDMEVEVLACARAPRRYKDQLMLSEWLVEVPPDFEENWVMMLCPVGRRNLVVAAKGRTYNYTKSGYRLGGFSSPLPGGSRSSSAGYTLLDCIFSEVDNTFYVLDVMCWNQHPVYECDTEFRFFWLESKLQELGGQELKGAHKFKKLSSCPCNVTSMNKELGKNLNKSTDGVLFYHKKSFYTFGATPLVLWLKPDMLSDMLGLTLPAETCTDMK